MPAPPSRPCSPAGPTRRRVLRRLTTVAAAPALLAAGLAAAPPARAQAVELGTLRTWRRDGALELEFNARITLPRAVEEALQRGVPLYFVAEAQLLRSRWYWRDERVARVSRSWRIAFQPLTGQWRVALGGLGQSYATLPEALAAAASSSGWRIADLAQLEAEKSYLLEFSYRLDTTQLPGPMQFGLVTPAEWTVGVSRTLRLDP